MAMGGREDVSPKLRTARSSGRGHTTSFRQRGLHRRRFIPRVLIQELILKIMETTFTVSRVTLIDRIIGAIRMKRYMRSYLKEKAQRAKAMEDIRAERKQIALR